MKKILTLALVLVMALGLAAPALAYTNNTATSTPYTADIYLTDYSTGGVLFGSNLALATPASDRGYARNEVAAAIAQFTVPAGADIMDIYSRVGFGGTNVTLNVVDNRINGTAATLLDDVTALGTRNPNWTDTAGQYTWVPGDNEIRRAFTTGAPSEIAGGAATARTYSFLFFAKVLQDDATMYVNLNHGAFFAPVANWATVTPTYLQPAFATAPTFTDALGNPWTHFMILNDDYIVYTTNVANATARRYLISDNPDAAATAPPAKVLEIEVLATNATSGVLLWDGANAFRFFMTPSGDITIHDLTTLAQVTTNSARYNALLANFNTIFDALGLTLSNRTNIMVNRDFTAIANAVDITETVDLKPWTPYVQIPDVVIDTPPKTGDAASILGFVIIALAGVAAVVVRKVRA